MTMLVAHSAWGIVTPEICGARFRQGTSGESDGTGSGLSGGSVALVALRSHLSSAPVAGWPWALAGAARGPCGAPSPWSGGMHVNFSDWHPFPGC